MDANDYAEASMLLMGVAAMCTGAVALLLPRGRRLEALIALVVGAGTGIAVLGAAGLLDLGGEDLEEPRLFFIATIFGFAAVAISLGVLWRRRAARDAPSDTV
ncbi:MAG TPA: hypothetical protein VE032_06270 [Actinomycetota bacterium]|nr:hypothetical protein [Actinomycetota bacterium]